MWPRTIRAQLGLLVFAAFIAAQVLAAWLFTDERGAAIRAVQQSETTDRAVALAGALNGIPDETRDAILAATSSPSVRFDYGLAPMVSETATAVGTLAAQLPATARSEEIALTPC